MNSPKTDQAMLESMFPSLKGRESFRVGEIATMLSCSTYHVHNLIEEGFLKLLDAKAKRSMRRVSAEALRQFLSSRLKTPGTTTPPAKKRKS
jgi:hypothetical protein